MFSPVCVSRNKKKNNFLGSTLAVCFFAFNIGTLQRVFYISFNRNLCIKIRSKYIIMYLLYMYYTSYNLYKYVQAYTLALLNALCMLYTTRYVGAYRYLYTSHNCPRRVHYYLLCIHLVCK